MEKGEGERQEYCLDDYMNAEIQPSDAQETPKTKELEIECSYFPLSPQKDKKNSQFESPVSRSTAVVSEINGKTEEKNEKLPTLGFYDEEQKDCLEIPEFIYKKQNKKEPLKERKNLKIKGDYAKMYIK